ncbi:MAG: gliding motility lipoprotein GldD [Bacteroidetes bacterium]|nr:gliding motility lipoprotein GldD [Bacteroidota bacterium]
MKKHFMILAASILLFACENAKTPRPHAYFKIDFPAKSYVPFNSPCPFRFEVPFYVQVVQDSSPNAEPCWLNMNFVPYNATLHLTYKPIGTEFNLVDLQNDSRRFVMNHTIKAQEILENEINKPAEHVHGVLYRLKGNTATSLQFYVTDSTKHYLRGALYFNTHTNPDSIAPVLEYLSEDVLQLIGTLKWSY